MRSAPSTGESLPRYFCALRPQCRPPRCNQGARGRLRSSCEQSGRTLERRETSRLQYSYFGCRLSGRPDTLPATPSGSLPACASVDFFGSSSKSSSSVIHLCRSVKRMLVGSRSGNFSYSASAMSSRLVPGELRHQILVPFRAPRTAVFIMFSASFMVA